MHSTEIIAYVAICMCLSLLFFIEIIAIYIRVSGGLFQAPHLANHLAVVTLLFGRAATAVSLVGIGWALDNAVPPKTLAILYGLFLTILSISLLWSILNKSMIDGLIVNALGCNNIKPPSSTENPKVNIDKKFIVYNVLIGIFLVFGFCVPSMLASLYNEYRATLLQLGFLFNSFATLLSAFYLERRIAIALHEDKHDHLQKIREELLLSRTYSAIIGLLGMIVFYVAT